MKNGLDADIKTMSQAEKTMLRYQYVLANTGAAQGDFARTSQTWANQTRILKQQLEQLGSVLGGTFINLLKPLVSALNQAMSHIIAFAQTVSNALGKIFGWKFEVQGGVAGDLEDGEDAAGGIAGDMEDAADSAKKLNKQLRAFDELNTINLKDKSGSGSGAGGAGANTGQGEWVKTDAMFKDYESDINSLYELGKRIGDALKNMLNDIDWDSIYEGARNFGKGLAEFLNGLISPELFGALGRTIAGCINTALHFLDSFGETFDWANFGLSLATGLNEFMYAIDWDTALSAAKNWGKGIAKTLNAFLRITDFNEVGATIANALNTAIQFAFSFADTFDGANLGNAIAGAINGFFANFDFAGLAETLNLWVDDLESAIGTALTGIKWSNVLSGLGNFFGNLEIDTIAVIVGAIAVKKILKAKILSSALSGVAHTIATSLGASVSATIASAGGLSGLLTLDMAALVGETGFATAGLLAGGAIIGGIIAAFAGWNFGQWLNEQITGEEIEMTFTEQMEGIIGSVKDGTWKDALELWAQDIVDWQDTNKKAFELWGQDISGTFEELGKDIASWWKTDVVGALGLWANDISSWWDENVAPWFTKEKWSELWSNVQTACNEKWGELKEWFANSTFATTWEEDIAPWFTVEQWSLLWDNVQTAFLEKWEELKAWWQESTLCQWWEEDISPWFTIEKWSELWENVKSAFTAKWGEIEKWWKESAITKWWNQDVKPWFTKEKWAEAMSGVKEAFKSTWNAAISSIKEIWNKFASWLNEKLTWTIEPVVVMGKTVFEGATINLGRIPTFQAGGYPEDGLFMANHGELVGKFSNGKTAVANNEQITEGIAQAVYPAVYNAVSSALANNRGSGSEPIIKVIVGDRELTDIVVDEINERYMTGGNPLLI